MKATVLIPTHDHAALLSLALESALAQGEVEVFVVGDGVKDSTREVMRGFKDVRFFDFPKGERHGELHRHQALQEASGKIVCYLSDDDLLLPGHVDEMCRLLENADFAHAAPVYISGDGDLVFRPVDLEIQEFHAWMQTDWNAVGLTGAAHTLALYRRLPVGWNPGPPETWSDLHMWQQILSLPGVRALTGTKVTYLHFPSAERRGWSASRRVQEVESWLAREPGLANELSELLCAEMRRSAIERELLVLGLKADLAFALRGVRGGARATLVRPR